MIIDPTTDSLFSIFSDDDRVFLKRICETYPEISKNFDKYLDIEAGDQRRIQSRIDLDEIKRAGWVDRGVDNPESVAEHVLGVANLVLTVPHPEGVNIRRVIEMVWVHDLAEAITTDFRPADTIIDGEKETHKISAEDKERLELLATRVIAHKLKDEDKILELMKEYIEQKTPEAIWIKDLDRLHAVLEAAFIEKEQPSKAGIFREFADYAQKKLKTDAGKQFLAEIDSPNFTMDAGNASELLAYRNHVRSF